MVVKEDKPINCTIVGDAMIGKSTLVKAFMNDNKPDTAYVATILETFEGRVGFVAEISQVFLQFTFIRNHCYLLRTKLISECKPFSSVICFVLQLDVC